MDFEFKRASKHGINIRHTANGGCIIKVGCCEAAFTTPDEMLETLADYYKDPEGMEKEYNALDPDGPDVIDTGVEERGCSSGGNRALRHSPISLNQGRQEASEPMDDQDKCEEIGPDTRR